MANTPLWFVRAGEEGAYAADFRSSNTVGIGWNEVGPVSADTDDDEINRRFELAYPGKKKGARDVWASQVRRYLREIRVGDRVITYDPSERVYLLGRIESDAEWQPERPLFRCRTVSWTHRVDRDALTESTRNKLGSIATLFKVGDEADAELTQNAEPLYGDTAAATIPVRGQRASALTTEDFGVLIRNPKSVPWPTLPENDRNSIKSLRQRLLQFAVKLRDEVGSTLVLKPFASHPTPSGRNASLYWSCVYPQTAPNKSFAFQLSVIVTQNMVEYGFGSGRATGEMDEEKLDELRTQFESQRERLKRLRNESWIQGVESAVRENGFDLRSSWSQQAGEPSEFSDLGGWIDFAASPTGGGAAVSKMISPAEALAHGDRFADVIVKELKPFVPLLDAIYSDTRPATPLPAIMPPASLTVEWLVEETLWDRIDIERVLDTLAINEMLCIRDTLTTSVFLQIGRRILRLLKGQCLTFVRRSRVLHSRSTLKRQLE